MKRELGSQHKRKIIMTILKNILVSQSKYRGRVSFFIPFFRFTARLVERVCLSSLF